MYSKATRLSIRDEEEGVQALLSQLTNRDVGAVVLSDLVYAEHCDCFVIKKAEKLVAFGALSIRFTPSRGFIGRMEDVVVDKDHRNQGLGSELIAYITSQAKALRLREIELTSKPERGEARHLYKKHGFVQKDTDLFGKLL